MRKMLLCFLCFLSFLRIEAQENKNHNVRKIIVIGVDGLKADGIERANTPNIDGILSSSLFSRNAKAVMPTVSTPNWMSILSSVMPAKHRFLENGFDRNAYRLEPSCESETLYFPTIFTLLKQKLPEKKRILIHQWKAFNRLINPLDIDIVKNPVLSANRVARLGEMYFKKEDPAILFLHFNLVDLKGHLKGYTHKKYYQSIEKLDKLIEPLIAIAQADPNVAILLISDHGGIGKGHGGNSLDEINVPFLFYCRDIDQYNLSERISNVDIASTIAYYFGLSAHPCWDGISVIKRK